MLPLLYDSGSWRSTVEVKSLSLNATPVLVCLLYYLTVTHEWQHCKWNHCPWMLSLLYESDSWRSTLEMKSLSLNFPPTIWQWLMKVTTGSEITILECLPHYMTVAHEGQYWKLNHYPWMPPLLYYSDSWRATLEMKSLTLNTSPTIWQRLTKVNSGSEITVLECLPYYMTVTHEGQHWKWNRCPWRSTLLYDRDSWRSPLEVKSLSLNAFPYNMTGALEGQHWNWNHCPWMPPLLYDTGSWRSTLEV